MKTNHSWLPHPDAEIRESKEIPLKQWIAEQAQRLSLSDLTIRKRLKMGLFPRIELRRVNKRVIYVLEKQ